MCFVFFTGARLFVLELVISYFVCFLFVIVWLSVPVQSIAWKDLSPLDSLRWFSQHRSPMPRFWGAHPQEGGCDPQIRTRSRFLYSAPPPSFVILCLLVLSYRVDKQNKQMLLDVWKALCYAMTLGRNDLLCVEWNVKPYILTHSPLEIDLSVFVSQWWW